MVKTKLQTNFSQPVVVFDTETGGLNHEPEISWNLDPSIKRDKGCRIDGTITAPAAPILELASVRLSPITLEEVDYFHTYIGPNKGQSLDEYLAKCHPIALQVNGFGKGERRKKLQNAPTSKEALTAWIKWLKFGSNRYQPFLPCGQNVRFDINMVNAACIRSGLDFQIKTNHILELISYSLVYFSFPNTGSVANYKLTTVAECLGISTSKAHTALADVQMTAECLRRFMREFTGA